MTTMVGVSVTAELPRFGFDGPGFYSAWAANARIMTALRSLSRQLYWPAQLHLLQPIPESEVVMLCRILIIVMIVCLAVTAYGSIIRVALRPLVELPALPDRKSTRLNS